MKFRDLKLGVKLGAGFGFVGILFVIVVFQYQRTLSGTIHGFEELLATNEQTKALVTNIGKKMYEMRSHEKDFLLTQDIKIVETVDMLLQYGYHNKASDIHIEPHDDYLLVRFRVDGVIHDVLKALNTMEAGIELKIV